jgi:hypothetical protein
MPINTDIFLDNRHRLATLPNQPNAHGALGNLDEHTSTTTTTTTTRRTTHNRQTAANNQDPSGRGDNIINVPGSQSGPTTVVNNVNVPGQHATTNNITNHQAPHGSPHRMGARDIHGAPTTQHGANQATAHGRGQPLRGASANNVGEIQAPANPYWALPNELFRNRDRQISRTWNTAEAARFRAGIEHQFNYQRYRAVMDIRENLLQGSDILLYPALDEKKLWIRMNAAMGLADFGHAINLDTVEKALGEDDGELIANFFRRFATRPTVTEGELYVMRYAIRLVNSKARHQILRTLRRQDQHLADLYLVAGTYDPAVSVRQFARTAVRSSGMDPNTLQSYNNVVLGIANSDSINIRRGDFNNATPSIEQVSDEYISDRDRRLMSQQIQFFDHTTTIISDDEEGAVPAGTILD